MAKKTPKKVANKPKNSAKKPQKKVLKNSRSLRLPILFVAVILFAAVGTYLLSLSQAQSDNARVPEDVPSKGLIYKGLKKPSKGDCPFVLENDPTTKDDSKKACVHPDPVPEGQNIKEREANVDKMMSDLAEQEKKNPPLEADAPPTIEATAEDSASTTLSNVGSAGSLGAVTGRNYYCDVDGDLGYKVRFVYTYPSGGTNRLSTYRASFEAIAKRMNAVVYNSAVNSGDSDGMGIRMQTTDRSSTGTCSLVITAIPVSGTMTLDAIKTKLMATSGYNRTDRKYMVFADSTWGCGLGEMIYDKDPLVADNRNNNGPMYAAVWRGCWNYAEPHELGHMLGAVQSNAPYSTSYNGHCRDQNDVMCYDDDANSSTYPLIARCTSTAAKWRYDCGQDTYFDAYNPSTYLRTNWNIAKNRFLRGQLTSIY